MSLILSLVLVFSLVTDAQNNIQCSSSSPCTQSVVTCPSNPGGSECLIRCDSPGRITPTLGLVSCANKTLKVTGPYMAPFRVICSNPYACLGTRIICDFGNCEIECTHEFACFGVDVTTQLQTYWTVHMRCQGPFSCVNGRMNSQGLGVVRLDCRGERACNNFFLTGNGRNEVNCNQRNACQYANFNFVAALVGHQFNCEGQTACIHTRVHCPGGRCDFQCLGRSSCQFAHFSCLQDTCNMDCSNIESCGNSTFLWGGVPSAIRCRGRASCWGTTFEAFRPAVLTIQCNQVESCLKSRIICHSGATCNTMCEPPDIHTCQERTMGSECRCAIASNCLNVYGELFTPCLGVSDSPTRTTGVPTGRNGRSPRHVPGTPSTAPTRPTPAPVRRHQTNVVMVMSFQTELSKNDFKTYLSTNKRSFKIAIKKGLIIATRFSAFSVNDIKVSDGGRRRLFEKKDENVAIHDNNRRRLVNTHPTDLHISSIGAFNLAELVEAVESNPGAVRASIGSELSKTGLNAVSVAAIQTTTSAPIVPGSNVAVVRNNSSVEGFIAVIIIVIVLVCLCGACLWYGYSKFQKVKQEQEEHDDDDDDDGSIIMGSKRNQGTFPDSNSYQRNYERDDEKTNEQSPLQYNNNDNSPNNTGEPIDL